MAQKVEIKVLDDLTGDEGATTTEFALDGTAYEIDLTEDSRAALDAVLIDYINSARRASGSRRRPGALRTSTTAKASTSKSIIPKGSSTADKELRATVRAWAQSNGIPIGARGRIADDIMEAYDAQNPALAKALQEDARVPVVEPEPYAAPSMFSGV